MQLFYTPDIEGSHYTLNEEESKHCVRVLRLTEGDTLHLTDGRGGMYVARIVSASPKRCEVEVVETRKECGKRPYSLCMAVAPTKNADRFEWFLEKATEIGTDRFIPVECDHSERRVLKTDRCEKVVTSAVKQSLKAYHPQLDELTPFDKIVSMPFNGDKFIAHCDESSDKKLLRDLIVREHNVLILIGPEGDFSPREVALAKANGFREISLGASRLRTETAGVAACHTVALMNE